MPLVAAAVPGYDSRGWFGYVAPVGTPPEIVARLNDEINRAMRQPDVSEKLVALGLIIVAESPGAKKCQTCHLKQPGPAVR